MFNTVRARLMLNSVLISAAAVLAVALATLLLVDAYFRRQERTYLESQAQLIIPLLHSTGSGGPGLAPRVQAASRITDLRVQVTAGDGQLLADSGERQPITVIINAEGSLTVEQLPGEHIQAWPAGTDVLSQTHIWEEELLFGGVLPPDVDFVPAGGVALTTISGTSLDVPLRLADGGAATVTLSEGPAVGKGIVTSIQWALLGGSIVALLVAVGVGWLSARQVVQPLGALESAAGQMATGDLTARAPRGRLRETNRLADQLNRMATELAATIQRLEDERSVLRRMIADASHELRTPLTALKTFNTLLASELPADNANTQTFVAESGRQLDQLDRLTRDMLDLSRLEGRLRGAEFVTVDLRDAVQAAARTFEPLAAERGVALDVTLPAAALLLPHDPAAIEQAVGNVVHNAIKAAPAGTAVGLALTTEAGRAVISVSDQGPGIPAEARPYIFDRFYRAPDQREPGSGLGLSIAQAIAGIHGGTIDFYDFDSTSTFRLLLPLTDHLIW